MKLPRCIKEREKRTVIYRREEEEEEEKEVQKSILNYPMTGKKWKKIDEKWL